VTDIPANTRTYVPKLVKLLLFLCQYLGRYRNVLLEYLPDGSDALIDAVLVACFALEAAASSVLPDEA
jgi:hypothetical protein